MKLLKILLVCVSTMMSCSIIFSTAGCKSQSAIERTVQDTVRVERKVTLRDTVFKTNSVTIRDSINIPCPDMIVKPIVRQKDNARLTVKQVGQILGIECVCDTIKIKAKLKDTYEKEYHSRWMQEVKTQTKKERYVPGWITFLAWSGGAFWALLIIYLIKKIYLKK
jgi:hypothetical protein